MRVVCVQVQNYQGMGARYVNALYRGVTRNSSKPVHFTCFTDDPSGYDEGVEALKLPSGINGWWNKVALFHPNAFEDGERVTYLDLDTVVVNSIDELLDYDGPFAALEDVYRPGAISSGVMAWEHGMHNNIWEEWKAEGFPSDPHGDQGWIERKVGETVFFQDAFPGKLVSYKVHCRSIGTVPTSASVVFFHGKPRPHECPEEWVSRHWDSQSKSERKVA